MLTIATFLWEKSARGFQLPSSLDGGYTGDHVLRLRNAIARNYKKPHRFVCITDRDIPGVECIPLWDEFADLGGCYRRLRIFAPDFDLAPRFAVVDLDCVITGNLSPIFGRTEDFVINSYNSAKPKRDPDQYYNGSLMLLTAGSMPHLYTDFDPVNSPAEIARSPKECVGTDQAWIRLRLGKSAARFTCDDGVNEFWHAKWGLPDSARIVFFSGRRDPSQFKRLGWVKQNWR